MITLVPHSLCSDLGALLSALIIIASAIGLTMNIDVYAGVPRRDFYYYFTNLSNLLVFLYFALLAPLLYTRSTLHRYIPMAEFIVAMNILLTSLVFHFLILPHVHRYTRHANTKAEFRILAANTLFVHYLVPWLTFAYWLLCSPGKDTLPWYAALLWTLFPLGYAAATLCRASRGRNIPGLNTAYPYPFLNVCALGPQRVTKNCILLLGSSILISGSLLFALSILRNSLS